jgi:hypothetical protein
MKGTVFAGGPIWLFEKPTLVKTAPPPMTTGRPILFLTFWAWCHKITFGSPKAQLEKAGSSPAWRAKI